jgi:hypothetical protein
VSGALPPRLLRPAAPQPPSRSPIPRRAPAPWRARAGSAASSCRQRAPSSAATVRVGPCARVGHAPPRPAASRRLCAATGTACASGPDSPTPFPVCAPLPQSSTSTVCSSCLVSPASPSRAPCACRPVQFVVPRLAVRLASIPHCTKCCAPLSGCRATGQLACPPTPLPRGAAAAAARPPHTLGVPAAAASGRTHAACVPCACHACLASHHCCTACARASVKQTACPLALLCDGSQT